MNYKLIQDIAKRCYESAQHKGKDVSCAGCLQAFRRELAEYWEAADTKRTASREDVDAVNESLNVDENTFRACYESRLHNTAIDELADIVIVAATWLEAAAAEGDKDGNGFALLRSADVALISGTMDFVAEICVNDPAAASLSEIVNLKMRFNELRQD